MLVRDIGVGALDAASEIGADEQVEDPVDAVRRDPAVLVLRNLFRDVVGARRPVEARQRGEHGRAHVGPLLALIGQPRARRCREQFPFVELVVVLGHDVCVTR